jgi:hypothetical protein
VKSNPRSPTDRAFAVKRTMATILCLVAAAGCSPAGNSAEPDLDASVEIPDTPDASIEDIGNQEQKALLNDEAPPVGYIECMAAYESRYPTPVDEKLHRERRRYCHMIGEVTTLSATKHQEAYSTCLSGKQGLRDRFVCGLRSVTTRELCAAFADGHPACGGKDATFSRCIAKRVRPLSTENVNLEGLVALYRADRNKKVLACKATPTSAELDMTKPSSNYWQQGSTKQRYSLPVATPALAPDTAAKLILRMKDKTGARLPTPVAIANHRRTQEALVLKGVWNSTKGWWEFSIPASMMSKGLFVVMRTGTNVRRSHPTFSDNDVPSCENLTCQPGTTDPLEKVSEIWLGQTHLQRLLNRASESRLLSPSTIGFEPALKLIGSRDTLVKVDASATAGGTPNFLVHIYKDGETNPVHTIAFDPPSSYPIGTTLPWELGKDVHSHVNSFRAIIPGTYIDRGYRMKIALAPYPGQETAPLDTSIGEISGEFDFGDDPLGSNATTIHVGAPTVLPLNIFEFRLPNPVNSSATIPDVSQFAAQLPASRVPVQRIVAPEFDKILIPTSTGTRIVGLEAQTVKHEGDVAFVAGITGALQAAAGQTYRSIYASVAYDSGHLFSGSAQGKGTIDGYRGYAFYPGSYADGVLFHEWTHALNSSHPSDAGLASDYIFRDFYYGVSDDSPSAVNAHMGPIWAWLPASVLGAEAKYGTFVDPVMNRGMTTQRWRKTPLTVGHDDRLSGFVMGHFSLLETRVMQNQLEGRQIVWGSDFWYHWDDVAGTYSRSVSGPLRVVGRDVPEDRTEQNVVSVLFSAWHPSNGGAEAHLIYPPIAYKSTLIKLIDPRALPSDAASYCRFGNSDYKCDYTVRVTREGVSTPALYMVRAANRQIANSQWADALAHAAINLPATPAITKVELLHTPDVVANGLPSPLPSPKATWPN